MTMALEVGVTRASDPWNSESHPSWLSLVQERFERLLPGGRDGGVAVTSAAIGNGLVVLQETMSDDTVAPNVVPTNDGGLQLEWHTNGVDLEVYVDVDGAISAWCREASREWEEDFYSPARIGKELSRLTADRR